MGSNEEEHGVIDPDYYYETHESVKRQKLSHDIDEKVAVRRIEEIIAKEFQVEIVKKEDELDNIQHRISFLQSQLDKLRACATISYYSAANRSNHSNHLSTSPVDIHPSIRGLFEETHFSIEETGNKFSQTDACISKKKPDEKCDGDNSSDPDNYDTRLRYKFNLIVGNVSKFIPPEEREQNDKFIYKWMVYVRTPSGDLPVENTISKVMFYLHPSYAPHQIVEVSDPPFHLTRRGWGEFPLRVQIFFHEARNKCVDMIHHLKLDKRQTRFQQLGAETNVELFLFRYKSSSPIDKPKTEPEKQAEMEEESPKNSTPDETQQNPPSIPKTHLNATTGHPSTNSKMISETVTNLADDIETIKPAPLQTLPNNDNYVNYKSSSVANPKVNKIQRFIKCRNKDGKIMFLPVDKLASVAKIKPAADAQLLSTLHSLSANRKVKEAPEKANGVTPTFIKMINFIPTSHNGNTSDKTTSDLKPNGLVTVSSSCNVTDFPNKFNNGGVQLLKNMPQSLLVSNQQTTNSVVTSVSNNSLKAVTILSPTVLKINGQCVANDPHGRIQYRSLLKPVPYSSTGPRKRNFCEFNLPLLKKKSNDTLGSKSPESTTQVKVFCKFTNMQDLVWHLARKHPLIDENTDRWDKHYCCKNLEMFSKWSLAKRRSCEWQRAKAINNECKNLLRMKWNTILKNEDLWCTKKIILFCRRVLFTPPYLVVVKDKKEEVNEEINSDSESELDTFAASTLQDATAFVNDLALKYPPLSETEPEEEIDVVNMAAEKNKSENSMKCRKENELVEKIDITLPSSSQAEFIRDVTSEIGVEIKPVLIFPDVQACVLEDMIYKVTNLFVGDMIRSAHSAACDLDRKSFSNEIRLRDVTASILNNSKFSFLSPSYGPNYPSIPQASSSS